MTETGNGATPPGLALLDQLEGSKLVTNIMHFGRVLRSTGMPVGPGKILDAVQAVLAVGIASRRDFYWSLHAVFVNRRDQHEIFDQAFHIFWRDPHLLERMLGLLMPQVPGEQKLPPEEPPNRRVMEALNPENKDGKDRRSCGALNGCIVENRPSALGTYVPVIILAPHWPLLSV